MPRFRIEITTTKTTRDSYEVEASTEENAIDIVSGREAVMYEIDGCYEDEDMEITSVEVIDSNEIS